MSIVGQSLGATWVSNVQEEIESEKIEVERIHPKYRAPELDNLFSKEFIDVKVSLNVYGSSW